MEKTVRIVSFQEAEELDIQYWKKATAGGKTGYPAGPAGNILHF